MKQTTYTVQVIQPSDGHILTQSSDIDLKDRIFSEKIFLGINDSIDNWKEILIKEADNLKQKQRDLIEKELKK
jgi:hypothetical protein